MVRLAININNKKNKLKKTISTYFTFRRTQHAAIMANIKQNEVVICCQLNTAFILLIVASAFFQGKFVFFSIASWGKLYYSCVFSR